MLKISYEAQLFESLVVNLLGKPMKKRTIHILLADDDPDDQEMMITAFSKVNPAFQLHIVNTGKQAIEFLNKATEKDLPCLIMLDYNMPELTGIQVVKDLSKNKRFHAIPKVILSTSSNPKYISDCLNNGADAYKVKPDTFEGLIHVAEEVLALCKAA